MWIKLKAICLTGLILLLTFCSLSLVASDKGLVAWWKLDEVVKAWPGVEEGRKILERTFEKKKEITFPKTWSEGKKRKHQEAEKLARSLTKDIFLRHEKEVEGDLKEGKPIKFPIDEMRKAWEFYNKKVGEDVTDERNYLVEIWDEMNGIFAKWKGEAVIESVTKRKDMILRNFYSLPGVSGNGVKFDGFTTHIIREAAHAPHFTDAFSVEAWIAPQAYPWNWCAIVNQEKDHKAGYFFGINGRGQVGLHLAVNNRWQECTTEERVPFMAKWSHIVGTFDKNKGIKIYINGKEAAFLPVKGKLIVANDIDLQIGRNHKKTPPAYLVRPEVSIPASYSFDGIIDELKIYNRALQPREIEKSYKANKPESAPTLTWRKLPQIPEGPRRFGAYYTRLKFYKEWDALWRVGDYPDIVVKFDESPVKMVFWRGTSYNMNLVTENGRWVGDQSAEGGGGDVLGCCEHMSDKQCRYAHVRIIENNDARAVVHWRYSLCDVLYRISSTDPITNWGNWADEYYYIYPDGAAIRHFVIHGREPGYSITEPAALNQPGEKTEDNVEISALTMANLKGESRTYTWDPWPGSGEVAGDFYNPIPDGIINVVNFKSQYKPFYIYEPGTRVIPYGGGLVELHKEYSKFPTWNHWPVCQMPSDGRYPQAPDRVCSSAITSPEPPMERTKEGDLVGRFIMGLTNKPARELVLLAKSWLQPAQLKLKSNAFGNEGYSRDERAYILFKKSRTDESLEFVLNASENSPIFNPAVVIKNWGEKNATLKINNRAIKRGKDFRFGYRRNLQGIDLVVWIKYESRKPITISLSPES